jgi:uncharacterized protein YbaR (Trm112 family)
LAPRYGLRLRAAGAVAYGCAMPVSPELLEILACPQCKTPMAPDGKLVLKEDQSGFVCQACKLLYRIEDDIPNFLIEEATPVSDT